MSSATAPAPTSSVGPEFFYPDLAIDRLRPSPLNPRKHFDPARLVELATSMKSNGVIEPLVARAVGDHYEIVCGERRLKAARIAELTTLPVMVRCLEDDAALEIMVIENTQREDVEALDEARGFRALLDTGYGLDKLADRIGLSKKFIYDRLKLLQLIPEAEQLLAAGHMTAGHAILLARLKAEDQARAIDGEMGGLFMPPEIDSDDENDSPAPPVDVVTVRELDSWIERNVRIDLASPVEVEDYPEVAAAQETAERVVSITYAHYMRDQDEDTADGDRILLRHEWKRADGSREPDDPKGPGSPQCPRSVLGAVVIGHQRGTAFKVCVDPACDIHWKKERAQKPVSGPSDAEKKRRDDEQRQWKEKQERENAERMAYRTGAPRIIAAFVERVTAVKPGVLVDAILTGAGLHPKALSAFPKVKTAEDLLRIIAVSLVAEGLDNEWTAAQQVPLWAKRLGVDLKPLLKPDTVQTSAPKAPAKKKAAKARR